MCESVDILEALVKQIPRLHFSDKREFSNIVRFFYGDIWYAVAQVAYNISLQSLNIASIIVSAQACDNLLLYFTGSSHAIELYPDLRLLSTAVRFSLLSILRFLCLSLFLFPCI